MFHSLLQFSLKSTHNFNIRQVKKNVSILDCHYFLNYNLDYNFNVKFTETLNIFILRVNSGRATFLT